MGVGVCKGASGILFLMSEPTKSSRAQLSQVSEAHMLLIKVLLPGPTQLATDLLQPVTKFHDTKPVQCYIQFGR